MKTEKSSSSSSIWNQIDVGHEHWTNLLESVHDQTCFPLQWNFDHLLPQTQTPTQTQTQPPITIERILRNILWTIKKPSQKTMAQKVDSIAKSLKTVLDFPNHDGNNPIIDLDIKKSHLYLRLIDYLVQKNMMTLAVLTLQRQLSTLLHSPSLQNVCHLRIASLFLDLDLAPHAAVWIGQASSGAIQHSATQLELDLSVARCNFQYFKFTLAFRAFNRLLPKVENQSTRNYIIRMRILSALLSPPHLRHSFLSVVERDVQDFETNACLKLLHQTIEAHLPILQHSEVYQALVSLLPPQFISQGILLQATREHNIWERSLTHNLLNSIQLASILELDQTEDSRAKAKEFVETMVKRGRLNATIIIIPSTGKLLYKVIFNKLQSSASDQSTLDRVLQVVRRLKASPKSCSKIAPNPQTAPLPQSPESNELQSKKRKRYVATEPSYTGASDNDKGDYCSSADVLKEDEYEALREANETAKDFARQIRACRNF